jgi:hypothetical protein
MRFTDARHVSDAPGAQLDGISHPVKPPSSANFKLFSESLNLRLAYYLFWHLIFAFF